MRPHNVFDTYNVGTTNVNRPFHALAEHLDTDCPEWLANMYFDMDNAYIFHHAPSKEISRYAEILLEGDPAHPAGRDDVFIWQDSTIEALMITFWSHYGDAISRILDTLYADYNPLHNYDMSETRTPDLTETSTVKSDVKTTGSNKVYGFNSSAAVPATETDAETETQGALTDNQSTRTNTGTESLTRSGNIGVTTSQQMLISELDLRTQHEFEEIVFAMLDNIMTCGAYTHGVTDFKPIR